MLRLFLYKCYLLHGNRNLLLARHILQPNLVVQQGLEQRTGATSGTVHVPLTVSHGVVGVHAALAILVEPRQDVADVVGEEALVVEHHRGHLRHSRGVHHLAMVMEVAFHTHTCNLHEQIILTWCTIMAEYRYLCF